VAQRNDSELGPAQAGFRFVIEILAITSWAIVGWNITDGPLRFVLVVALPIVAATVWATFRAPGDHSAGGGAPIAVPGVVRLLLELDVLLGAAIAVALVWRWTFALALAVAVVAHYATTAPRVRWLLAQGR